MSLIFLIITLTFIGALLWIVITYIPMQPPFPKIIIGVVVICTFIWLLQVFGVINALDISVPKIRHSKLLTGMIRAVSFMGSYR